MSNIWNTNNITTIKHKITEKESNMKKSKRNRNKNSSYDNERKLLDKIKRINSEGISNDPSGSYTGITDTQDDKPVQDADDL